MSNNTLYQEGNAMLRIAICDDEVSDCEKIYGYVQNYIEKKNITAQVKTYNHPDALLSDSDNFRPNIYILDIIMPMLTGIQTARELRWNHPDAQIIFATSEKTFALEAYDVNPINYILKPVEPQKFENSLERAISNVDTDEENAITVKIKGGFQTIRICEIMYIDYRNHVVYYHLLSGEEIATATLRIGFAEYMSDKLPEDIFVRCHESIYVNIAAIDKITRYEIVLRNKAVIPVSKSRFAQVAKKYMDYRL